MRFISPSLQAHRPPVPDDPDEPEPLEDPDVPVEPVPGLPIEPEELPVPLELPPIVPLVSEPDVDDPVSEPLPVEEGDVPPMDDPLRPWRIRPDPEPDSMQSFIMRACAWTCETSAPSFASILIVAPLSVFSTFTSASDVIG